MTSLRAILPNTSLRLTSKLKSFGAHAPLPDPPARLVARGRS